MHQDADASAMGFLPSGNQVSAEQQQELGQAGGLRMERAALERIAQLALEELARSEGQE